jgi:hypothetical protein
MVSDWHLMIDQARRMGQDLPLVNVHAAVLEACRQTLKDFVRHGEGDSDNSVVIEEIRRRVRAKAS